METDTTTHKVIPIQQVPYSRSRQAGESQTVLDHIVKDFADNPKAMQYFYDLFQKVYCQGEEVHTRACLSARLAFKHQRN